ncbi:MAG: TolC family protein [Bacteroidales bacterium]|nr:TolC family protein [Bacteroidales bacterium]
MMKIKNITRTLVALGLVAGLSGCHIYKKYETPTDTPITKAYAEALEMPVDSAAFGNLSWQSIFTDPLLVDLINRALENNTNLRNAQLNVEVARAQVLGAKLSYLPSVALAPNVAAASYDGADLGPTTYTIPAQVSWEIDVFGKILNSKRGAQAALYQSEAYAQAVRSQIIAGVATTYYTIAAINNQLNLSRNTAAVWKETVQTMRDLKEAGRGVTEAAVVQSAANYYSILASITDLETTRVQLNNSMSLLLNTMPQEWPVTEVVDLQIPAIYRAGVPMAELASRPDVRASEQSLAAAYYSTNSARAAFYPGLNIVANGGFTNLLGSMVKNPGVWFYNLAGSLAAPLFSRGQNIARLKAAKLQQQQALNNFEYTILSAASEVSNALTTYEKSKAKAEHLIHQVENLEKSVEYTNDLMLYSTGSTSYLEVLTAQSSLLQAQISQITTELAAAKSVINLYQSLGGGR